MVLVKKPLNLECIAYEANLDCILLEKYLGFLTKNGLVEERMSENKTLYAITERGVAVLRALNFQKYLGKIKDTVRAIDEALEIIPDISESNRKFRKKSNNNQPVT